MAIEGVEQPSTNSFAGTGLKQHVIRHDDRGRAVLFEDRHDVLNEIELLVRGRDLEIWPLVILALGLDVAVVGENFEALLAAEGRIGQDVCPLFTWIGQQRIGARNRTFAVADTVKIEIHRRETDDAGYDIEPGESPSPQLCRDAFVLGARMPLHVLVGLQQEPARAAGWITDLSTRLRIDDFDDGVDERTWREVLAGAGFDLGGVAFEQSFIDCSFHVDFEAKPCLPVDELHEALQPRRILDGVLCLEVNRTQQAVRPTQCRERPVVRSAQLFTRKTPQTLPPQLFRNDRGFAQEFRPFLVHLEEQKARDLLDVVAIRDAGVSYGDYVEQITCLLFLKMDQERTEFLGEPSIIPKELRWERLRGLSGEKLGTSYNRTLAALSRSDGLLGAIYLKAKNAIEDPARLQRLVQLIDGETWLGLEVDVKGAIYEGLLERNAAEVKSGAGQYFTPRPLIDAIIEVVDPQ